MNLLLFLLGLITGIALTLSMSVVIGYRGLIAKENTEKARRELEKLLRKNQW